MVPSPNVWTGKNVLLFCTITFYNAQNTKLLKKGVDIQDPLCYTITCREGENKKSQGNAVMRKCRNWQTSKTKDLVSIALVWVQVPSSALEISNEMRYAEVSELADEQD